MTVFEVPKAVCVSCGYAPDRASQVDGDSKPAPGDISICLKCGHLSAFETDLSLRPLTDYEIIEIAGDQRIIAAQRARAAVLKEKPI